MNDSPFCKFSIYNQQLTILDYIMYIRSAMKFRIIMGVILGVLILMLLRTKGPTDRPNIVLINIEGHIFYKNKII